MLKILIDNDKYEYISIAKCLAFFRIFAQDNICADIFDTIKSMVVMIVAAEINAIYEKYICDYMFTCVRNNGDEMGIDIKILSTQDLQRITGQEFHDPMWGYFNIYNSLGNYAIDTVELMNPFISSNKLQDIIKFVSSKRPRISTDSCYGMTYFTGWK